MSLFESYLNNQKISLARGSGIRTEQIAGKFFQIGLEYAEVGFAAAEKGRFIGPNLLHHALEYIFKGGIMRHYKIETIDDAENVDLALRTTYSHRLQDLWADFKGYYPGNGFENYDNLIEKLHDWEDIRYPRLLEFTKTITHSGKQKAFMIETNFQLTEQKKFELELGNCKKLLDKLKALLNPHIGLPGGKIAHSYDTRFFKKNDHRGARRRCILAAY